MSDYRRLVAYIYLYNQGKRVRNVGFTKVESRNGECRIQIQIKGAWIAEGNCCKFYIFYRKDGKMRGILLGETGIRSGSAQMKLVTETENIMQSGLDLGQMAGIIILSEKNHMFATRWDDEAVSLEQLVFHETEIPEEINKGTEQAVPEEAVQTGEDVPSNQMINVEATHLEAQALEGLWEKLRKGREQLCPFGEQDGGAYIFLEPKDLLTFRDNGKYLVNNSFLLHGFYNYGHILLGAESEDGMLVLGVPGEFYMQEKLMASLFGFPEFRKTVDAYGNVENMGYWLRKMEE